MVPALDLGHHRVHVGEVGADEGGLEARHLSRGGAPVQEDDVDNVVADVSLALDLTRNENLTP